MFWWKCGKSSEILVEGGISPPASMTDQLLSGLQSLQRAIRDGENKLQDLENYDFPLVLTVLEKVGNELAHVIDFPETAGMHLLTPLTSKSIMQAAIQNLQLSGESVDVEELCNEIKILFNRGAEIALLKSQIAEYKSCEQNIKTMLDIT